MIPIEEVEKDESGDSGPSLAEVKDHERDDQEDHQEKPRSSVAELRRGETPPPLAEAKGDHPDGEHEEKTEITSNPDTQAQAQPTSPADISTMKMALLSGDPSKVTALIQSMEEDEKLEALSTTYGGAGERSWDADEDNLFSWTSPILHAAQSGDVNMFDSVVAAIRNLRLDQAKLDTIRHAILINVDMNGQSLLALAARSGSKDVVQGVISVIKDFKLPAEKVERMRTGKNRDGCSLLAMAARSGSADVVQEVARILLPNELQEQLQEKDWVGRSVLAMAVRSGSKGVVEEVLQHVSKEKVQGMLAGKDVNDHSLLTMAAQSGSREVVEHVLRVFDQENLSEYKIQGMLRSVDIFGAPVLDHAVLSGNGDTFKTFFRIVTNKLTKQEVGEMLAYKDRTGGSLLTRAAGTGNSKIFDAVLDAVRNRLSIEEVNLILSQQDMLGRSLLESAVSSKEAEKIKAAMTSVSKLLTKEKVKELLREEVDTGSFLARAARTGKLDMFEAVLAGVIEKLSDDHQATHVAINYLAEYQVKCVISSRDKDRRSLLFMAVQSGSVEMFAKVLFMAVQSGRVEMFEKVFAVVSITPDEMKKHLMKKDQNERSLLSEAVISGNEGLFKTVLATLRAELSPEQMKKIISLRDVEGHSLLFLAVKSKSKTMFKVVLDAVSSLGDDDEVKKQLRANTGANTGSLLGNAALSGIKGLFNAVLATVKRQLPLEARKFISLRDVEGHSLLFLAVKSRSEIMFTAALDAVSSVGDDDEVKKQLRANTGANTGSLLPSAALSGIKGLFNAVLATVKRQLPLEVVREMILSRDSSKQSILVWAVFSTSAEMFKVVMDAVRTELGHDQQVNNMLTAEHSYNWSLLHYAARYSTREIDIFNVVKKNLSEEQVRKIIYSVDDLGRSSLASAAALSRNVEVFKRVLSLLSQDPPWQQRRDRLWTNSYTKYATPVAEAISYGDLGVCCIALRIAEKNLVDRKVQDALDASFMSWEYRYQSAAKYDNAREIDHCKRVLSMIFKHSARPPKKFLRRIVSKVTYGDDRWQVFTERVLSELESAKNPLILGMNVSVALAEAAERAPEGDQRILLYFQKKVDSYVLKVLEWLPQTVRGFENGMSQCASLFEPEGPRSNLRGRPGPLRVAFERRQQTKNLCAVPLIMDYISRRFTRGLPNMRDSGNVLQDRAELTRLAKIGEGEGGLVFGVNSNKHYFFDLDKQHSDNNKDPHPLSNQLELHPAGDFKDSEFLRVWLQGANASRPNLTFLPGLQFIVAGILAKPNSYYKVPALRMALDFVVYITMLWAYSQWVLLPEDGPLTTGEIAFAVYSLGAILRELRDMVRHIDVYLRDRWNVLDLLSLGILFGGFFYRLADSSSPWGRALYALSTPFVFSRLLFYAQFLPFQGSMVEVIFSMAKVILRFGVILVVVMAGFAMSLFPLLRNAGDFTFNEILLLLFKTLLGDVEAFDLFDESEGNPYAFMGRPLLALYLVVMTIMLLNLLIAVLSTAHAKVEVNSDKGLEVSKVRIIEYYRLIVDLDILPAPFNLVQFILTLPFFVTGHWHCTACRRILHAVGCVSFWLVLSPLAVAAGIILWVTSSIFSVFVSSREIIRSMPALTILGSLYHHTRMFLFCAFGAPTCLLFLWGFGAISIPITYILRLHPCEGGSTQTHPTSEENVDANEVDVKDDVHSMLEEAGVGACDIHKYLQDPMIDPRVRPDDVERGTTVEHMKLLRDRLETIFNERVDRLEKQFNERVDLLKKDLLKQG